MKYLTLILPILFEAISEGLYLHGSTEMKVISKQVQVLMIASYFILIWQAYKGQFNFWKLPVIYILARFVIFNYVHNLSAELPLNYLGKVSFIDRILVLACGGQFWMLILGQIICLIFIWLIIKDKI